MNILKNILQGIGWFCLYAVGMVATLVGIFLVLAILINYSLIVLPVAIIGLLIYAAIKKVKNNDVD